MAQRNMSFHKTLIGLFAVACLINAGVCDSVADSLGSPVPEDLPEYWVRKDAPVVFTKETLFEHIDGQADLFLQYGFEKSFFASYLNKRNVESRIDLDIYDMGTVLNSFGIFSRFRNEERPGGIGLESSGGDHYFFFYKGKYFVVLQSSGAPALSLHQFAQAVESRISDNSSPPKEIEYFQCDVLKPGSIEYFPEGLLGHGFLGKGFRATYTENYTAAVKPEGREFQVFLSIFENSQEALTALKSFQGYLSKQGQSARSVSPQLGPDALSGLDPYQGKIMAAARGPYVFGAVGYEEDSAAERQVIDFMNRVSGTR